MRAARGTPADQGAPHVSNALAAAAAAHALGVGGDLKRGLTTFEPIEHRLEPAGTACGADWFNDSKATNPDAVSKALARSTIARSFCCSGTQQGQRFRPSRTRLPSGAARSCSSASLGRNWPRLFTIPRATVRQPGPWPMRCRLPASSPSRGPPGAVSRLRVVRRVRELRRERPRLRRSSRRWEGGVK